MPERGLGNGVVAWHLCSMSTITVAMPEEDLAFLLSYSKAQGSSPEAYLAQQARNLREHLQRPIHADVKAASGIVPAGIDARAAHRAYLERKHG